MNEVPSVYQPLWEAKQEAMKEGNRSYGTKNSDGYKAEFGEEYVGQLEGEIGWQEIQELNN